VNSLQTETCAPRLLTAEQASAYLNIPVETLKSWRKRGKGPPFFRANRANKKSGRVPSRNVVRYPIEKLDEWIDANVEVPQ
jgi:hypothetical protein